VAFAALLVTVIALGIYARTVMPATGFWDTGEAQTVPPTLSIFHPTGFPAYTMIGWLWSQIPIGEVAWRMNMLSAVAVALAAGLVTLITGHLIVERHRAVAATGAGIAGLALAFAPEPWENATRADVHALNVFFVALIIWLLFAWRAAIQTGSPRAGGWLMGAALAFGVGVGNHPLAGLTAFGIAAWVVAVDRHFWRRWRLVSACAGLLALGVLGTYAYIPIRAALDPEPPLFYARPDTWDRLRYLVFAEQFKRLFEGFSTPLGDFGRKWARAEGVLQIQLFGPGWLLAAVGASVLAVRQLAALVFLGLVIVANVVYAMNFNDGDIDRYFMPTLVAAAPMLGVAIAIVAAAAGRAVAEATHRMATIGGRRRVARIAGGLVLWLGLAMPVASLVTQYESHDQSHNREADRWVASVYRALPPNAVIVSWWSYSTPLWYHRWVLGERPDITIIDERNILDDGYRTMDRAIVTFFRTRPVYVVPPHWERDNILATWDTLTVATYPGYLDLLLIEGRR
jgi:MFS family permease